MLQLEQKTKKKPRVTVDDNSNNNRCAAESLSVQEPQPAEYFASIQE